MSHTLKRPTRKFFIPATNSRHRTACLALLRALLRLAPQVSLPKKLATGWTGGRHPIAIYVQRAFRRNVADTSPRIIFPALTAGYRMLSVLQDAVAHPRSRQHASIVHFLRAQQEEHQRRNLANPPAQPEPRLPVRPLVVDVTPEPTPANPNPTPMYTTPNRPLPRSELGGTGRRKVPYMELAGDFPFLRFTKPQPPALSRVLGNKIKRRTKRITLSHELQEEVMPEAREEDAWDKIVAGLVKDEKLSPSRKKQLQLQPSSPDSDAVWQKQFDVEVGDGFDERSHSFTLLLHGVYELNGLLLQERMDQVARADAMRQLVIQEKALAEQEKIQMAAEKRARWEARMLEEHGDKWRDLFPNLKDETNADKRTP
ncbi:hypothetical protein F4777DRAFT_566887 [Nemania sp. FL0916]|nr:hypothetical protein F4777DRAFT_566887 [Nemania sp. FL0916]